MTSFAIAMDRQQVEEVIGLIQRVLANNETYTTILIVTTDDDEERDFLSGNTPDQQLRIDFQPDVIFAGEVFTLAMETPLTRELLGEVGYEIGGEVKSNGPDPTFPGG